MNKNEQVINIVKEFVDNGIDVCESDELKSIGIDSMKKVGVIVKIEEILNIQFEDADLNPNNINTVQQLIDLVSKYE